MGLDEVMQTQLKELRKKRGIIKAALTRMKNFVEGFDPTVDATSLLEFRQEELPRLNQKFDDIQTQIELIVVDDSEKEEEERNKFEFDYFNIRSQIQEIVNARKSVNTSCHNSTFNMSAGHSRAQLPVITLPVFDGDIQDWESFFDCFRAMIHDDGGFTPAQKFYYLRSSISGAALDLIKSVPMTDSNYEVAIERLKQRYDNRSLVIQSHIRSLLESPYVEQPTSKELQALHAHVSTHVAALKALNQPTEHWDAWLVTIIVSRLDSATSHGWQLRQHNTQLPKYSDLESFLASRCVAFEASESSCNRDRNTPQNLQSKGNAKLSRKTLLATNDTTTCAYCSGPHRIYYCEKFKALTINSRSAAVREKGICYNCLSSGHISRDCKSSYTCRMCKGKHNSLLHVDRRVNAEQKDTSNNTNESGQSTSNQETPNVSAAASLNKQATGGHVFLATALVLTQDKYGSMKKCKAILDTGSQINFISKRLVKSLQLPSQKSSLPVNGIGNSALNASAFVEIKIQSRVRDYSTKLVCYVLPNIVGHLPSCMEPKEGWNIPQELRAELADPKFNEAGLVDLLIGAGTFYELLESERIPLGVGNLSLQGTTFGWVVTGQLGATCLMGVAALGEAIEQDWVSRQIQKEEGYGKFSKSNTKCIEEERTLLHYKDTVARDKEGRFVLSLPVKPHANPLGDSSSMATSRLIGIERRLQQNDELRAEYNNFMREYLEMGHMSEVLGETEIPKRACYLPHHAVLKSTSLTTKVRVVFDASTRTTTGQSLNNILMRGPTVQQDIFSILTRFRKHQFVITADIEKMFRQINIAESDQDLQRILWRFSPSEAIHTYRLGTVTYGTTPASFMATQCLVTLAEQFKNQYPEASRAIAKDFYMDDLMSGADSEEQCSILEQQINKILKSAKLPLRKWCSNSSTVLEKIGKCNADTMFILEIKDDDTIKSLGLGWQPVTDQFQFTITMTPLRSKYTKRLLLSDLNRVFDPLGLLSPVLLKGKIFLQQIWAMNMDWDATLSNDIENRWKVFCVDLEKLRELNIPRKVKPEVGSNFELHGFCDASQEAYGACIYVRTRCSNGTWKTHLLCSKTRVAPIKGSTIPRLELRGALVLAELAKKVANSWEVDIENFILWTDSSIVLSWMNSQAVRLKTFVANRIVQILELTDVSQWRHVKGEENPADLASRGMKVAEIINSTMWWYGPQWMKEDTSQWTTTVNLVEEENLPETKSIQLALVASTLMPDLTAYYSDWNKLVKATAWLTKFLEYLKTRRSGVEVTHYLTVSDLRRAENKIIARLQLEQFSKEINALNCGQELSKGSKLKSLCPFMKDGLILVGGRLDNAEIAISQKHPIVLPAKHRITRLIFEVKHRELAHCGPQLLLAEIRRQYWPLRGRVTARSVVKHCVRCVRANPTFQAPIMAALPKERVQVARPFAITGVDFAGPLLVRSGIRRVTAMKAWIAVFVCFVTRAIHLEPVVGLTSDAFLAALRRFMSRRGKCIKIYSDNGTNFVGAQKELAIYVEKSDSHMAQEGVEWCFNPPSAPHFGGLWESAVKSTKYHLTRVVKEARLTLEELLTLLCQIEACVNSRPITPLSSDPCEPHALTPAHFLIGGPLLLPPEPDIPQESMTHIRRWKYVQGLMQVFWRRWSKEYLPQLQVRGRWVASKKQLSVDDIVIIKEETTAPTRWKLGRIIQTHPGKDGVVRVATVRLATGSEMKRPTVKLCVLPTEEPEVEN